jgi:hypothetical protein
VDGGVDERAPLFFLSYAHSAHGRGQITLREPNRFFFQFFDDLSENVGELVSRPPGSDPGFIDKSMSGGVHWRSELIEAIGTCQVFVALLSVRYFRSPWCSREWYAFSQRQVVNLAGTPADRHAVIVPVLWAPIPDDRFPVVVSNLQIFAPIGLPDPGIAAQYLREGVVGLMQMGQQVAYQAVVWRLAQHIARLHYSHRVEPRVFKPDELINYFEAG